MAARLVQKCLGGVSESKETPASTPHRHDTAHNEKCKTLAFGPGNPRFSWQSKSPRTSCLGAEWGHAEEPSAVFESTESDLVGTAQNWLAKVFLGVLDQHFLAGL